MKHLFFLILVLFLSACSSSKEITLKDSSADAIPSPPVPMNKPDVPLAVTYSFAQQVTAAQEAAYVMLQQKLGERSAISVTFQTANVGDTLVYGFALRNLYNYKTNFTIRTTFRYHQIPVGSSFAVENHVLNEWVDSFSQQNITLNGGEIKLVPLIIHVNEKVGSEQETLSATYYFSVSVDAYQKTFWKEYAEKEFSVKVK